MNARETYWGSTMSRSSSWNGSWGAEICVIGLSSACLHSANLNVVASITITARYKYPMASRWTAITKNLPPPPPPPPPLEVLTAYSSCAQQFSMSNYLWACTSHITNEPTALISSLLDAKDMSNDHHTVTLRSSTKILMKNQQNRKWTSTTKTRKMPNGSEREMQEVPNYCQNLQFQRGAH